MQKAQIRTTIDVDTRRSIMMAARRRSRQDIARKPQVDFVAEQVMTRYGLRINQVRGTALGREIDQLGEVLRQEMLQNSLKQVAAAA